jgi:hypothetical protein
MARLIFEVMAITNEYFQKNKKNLKTLDLGIVARFTFENKEDIL